MIKLNFGIVEKNWPPFFSIINTVNSLIVLLHDSKLPLSNFHLSQVIASGALKLASVPSSGGAAASSGGGAAAGKF